MLYGSLDWLGIYSIIPIYNGNSSKSVRLFVTLHFQLLILIDIKGFGGRFEPLPFFFPSCFWVSFQCFAFFAFREGFTIKIYVFLEPGFETVAPWLPSLQNTFVHRLVSWLSSLFLLVFLFFFSFSEMLKNYTILTIRFRSGDMGVTIVSGASSPLLVVYP